MTLFHSWRKIYIRKSQNNLLQHPVKPTNHLDPEHTEFQFKFIIGLTNRGLV